MSNESTTTNKKGILVFDIDETLLTVHPKYLHDKIMKTSSSYNPYDGSYNASYTINKASMTEILTAAIQSNYEIGFITFGSLSRDKIKNFFEQEYSIKLDTDFYHYCKVQNKADSLKKIQDESQFSQHQIEPVPLHANN